MRFWNPRLLAIVFVSTFVVARAASAQVDLAGTWASRMHEEWGDRYHGPDAVDFMGLPLTEDGRARALSYSSSMLAMPERQCLQYAPYYTELGPQNLVFWSDDDPVTGRLVSCTSAAPGIGCPARSGWMGGRTPRPMPCTRRMASRRACGRAP